MFTPCDTGEWTMMYDASLQAPVAAVPAFGLRKVAPRACIADRSHVQNFLCETLEELGFVTCKFDKRADVQTLLAEFQPDVFVLGPSTDGPEQAHILDRLSIGLYSGKVLIVGASASLLTQTLCDLGTELGLAMLPMLATPFNDLTLRAALSELLPNEAPPKPVVDVGEALHAGWLEVWYQPKIEIRNLSLCGAEALLRMRHPTWGIVEPASFLPDDDDPNFVALCDFVLTEASKAWHYFVGEYGNLELAINLPPSFLQSPGWPDRLLSRLPRHPAFRGAILEFSAADIAQAPDLVTAAADRLRLRNIALSVDDVGTDWPALMDFEEFPFVEIKIDRSLISGCPDDRLKQVVCRRILEFADSVGARTVAEGVENRAEFVTARELGFDVVQGYFLGKPMEVRKFARRALRQPLRIA